MLAGRYVEIRVYPLDFREYLDFAAENPEEASLSQQEQFANFLRFGGLPGIHQMKWEETRVMQYLHDIYNSVLLKDVIARNKIRDTALLESVIAYLMDNIGNTFSAKTITDFLKNQGRKLSAETVYNYLRALESAFLIHKAVRFDIKGKRILETQEKYYLSDLGLRHAVIGYRDNDIAGVLENIVYLELLRRGWTVHIGKQDVAEVDFVANRADERLYIQVCYVLTPENTEREFGPLEGISDNYRKTGIVYRHAAAHQPGRHPAEKYSGFPVGNVSVLDVCLDLSSRQYYRLRKEAISIRMWSVPEEELGGLVGLVEVLDS